MEDYFKREPENCIDGIVSFFRQGSSNGNSLNPVTKKINEFYEANPFPNYEGYDSLASFYEKAKQGVYGKMLDEQIPLNVRILEVGCGTGQLSNFLAHSRREVVASDLCLNSLKLANEFKLKNGINNVTFVHADIFDLPFREKAFDLVVCKGVLHHTYDCKEAFRRISELVRPGGFMVIGLYNKYGRIPTWLRKQSYRISPNSIGKIDYVLKNLAEGGAKRRAWILDQYSNPNETWHSVDEVLKWFGECGFSFVNGIPKITFSESFSENERLFAKHPQGNRIEHFLIQLSWIFTISREGALFDIIGRKNS